MKNFLTFFCCFVVLGCGNSDQNLNIKTLQPGDNAPSFNLKNIDGEMVSPEDYPNAKGFIVVFTANTCPIAEIYEDRIIALGKKYNSMGYPVLAINANIPGLLGGDGYEEMQKRAKAKGFTFPYLFDESQKVTDQYGARVTPHVFLLRKEITGLKVIYTGAIDNDTQDINPDKTLYIENAIAAIEAGEEIKVASTKAIGCTVKRP